MSRGRAVIVFRAGGRALLIDENGIRVEWDSAELLYILLSPSIDDSAIAAAGWYVRPGDAVVAL